MPGSVRLASEVLVGRDAELRDVVVALRGLPDGRPGVVAVSGAAGMGKTRFVRAVADVLRADGTRVMSGACVELGAGAPPYSALIGAFRSADPPAVQVLDALTGAVEMRRTRLFELLRSTIVGLARTRPTVLVIEDVHWSDRITRDVLRYLTTMAGEGRWGTLLTFREDEVAARPAVREFLDVLHSATVAQIGLEPLQPSDVGAQITGIIGEPVPADEAERVHGRSGGIPLLVEEVVAADRAGVAGVPGHLRDLFVARSRRHGATVARAVEVVAVVGDPCDDRLVAAVLGLDPATAAGALDTALSADVLTSDGNRYRMRHDLLREAVYDGLPPARRRHIHRRVATALSTAQRPDVAALARHWYEADEPIRAVRANLAAAALADRVHAPAAVRTYLGRALEYFDALPADEAAAAGGRPALLARAAEAASLSGAFQEAVNLAEEGLAGVGDSTERAMRLERLARYRWVSADGDGAMRAHEESITVLPDDAPTAVRARVLSGYAWHLAMAARTDEARQWSDQAVLAADASTEPLQRCRALLAWGLARADAAAGLAALWAARDLAVDCDAGDELGRAHAALDLALRRPGAAAERESVLRDGLGYVAAHGLGRSYGTVLNYLLAEVLVQLGRWDEAGELLAELAGVSAGGIPAMFADAFRARLAAVRGEPPGPYAEQVAAMTADIPQQPYPLVLARCALAESSLWAGDTEQAVAHAEGAREVATDPVAVGEADMMHARATADREERARTRGRPVQPTPETPGETYRVLTDDHALAAPYATTVRAELSRRAGQRAPRPWRDAVAAWSAESDPYRVAYCRWRLAHALLRTRAGRPEARRELTAAHRTAGRLGAQPLLAAVRTLAAAARIDLGDAGQPAGPAAVAAELGLTLREQEILPLLVAGRTNSQIAESLVISPRTVGVHVSRILQKLGASRRTEAADIARRRGLVRN